MCSHGSEMTEQPVCFVSYSASDFAGSASCPCPAARACGRPAAARAGQPLARGVWVHSVLGSVEKAV
jgi:hypothetical protein